MAKIISKTYGEALYELATEENKASEMLEEIQAVQAILAENPQFEKLMLHPAIPKQEKLEVVEKIFKDRISNELTGFLRIVVEKERYRELKAIFTYYVDKVKEEQGIGIVHVTTPIDLDETSREAVVKKLYETTAFHTLEMHYHTDESLIGGMIIRIGDRVVDSSVRSKLDEIKKQLLQIQLV